jgi:hypothetical protein
MTEQQWIECKTQLPQEGETVETKIHDEHGERNITPLKPRGRLWYYPDDSMYVYYAPTHWMPIQEGSDD